MNADVDTRSQVIVVKKKNLSDHPSFVRAAGVLLSLLCIPLFFIGLGVPPLLDPDEPVYAATARTMLQSGALRGWWNPHYNGSLWFDKPPLTYWVIGLSMKAFGQTAFAARLPSAICAAVLVAVTVTFAKRLWPKAVMGPFWAGAVIATSFQTVLLARAAVTDMMLTALLTFAMLGMWRWLTDEREVGWLISSGVSVGFAALTKGPVAIVLVGGAVLFYLLLSRQAKRLGSAVLWLSLLISIAVALPWYISMIHEHGRLFIDGFLEANNLTRYLQPEHPKTSSALWFVPVLFGFVFPWSVPLIYSLADGWRSGRGGDRASLFCMIWIAWVFAFFSASQTKLLTYIYPLYPLASILIGRWIEEDPARKQRIICGAAFSFIALSIAIILPGYVSRGNGLSDARSILEQIGVVFAVGSLLSAASIARRFEPARLSRQFVFTVPVLCIAAFFPLVALAPLWHESVPDLSLTEMSGYIRMHTSPGQYTIALGLKRPSLVFYSRRPILYTDDRKLTARLMESSPYPLCVIKNTNDENVVAELEKYLPSKNVKFVLHSGLKYVLIKYQL